ncbi:MAG TPA: methyltransferase domain-containing protein [Solirubrobacteraceae bacterium]|jgi:SAM-dependent methyltransferase|nr:methyltransferase domain-containing protein [Solirubrobacteraceae bacterium]
MSPAVASSTVLELYALGLGRRAGGDPVEARTRDGARVRLPYDRWLGPVDAVDEDLLSRAVGPVIDLGCGPGRHLHALARRGVFALGVDVSSAAVTLARDGGANAVEACVFGDLPGSGTWQTALLLDGNIGIGGCPGDLLERIGRLLAPDGALLVELDPRRSGRPVLELRLESTTLASDWFRWAVVGASEIAGIAARSGLRVDDRWELAGRSFARLLSRPRRSGRRPG